VTALQAALSYGRQEMHYSEKVMRPEGDRIGEPTEWIGCP
jgi:hypothetical protein